jgi:hypothetical protein
VRRRTRRIWKYLEKRALDRRAWKDVIVDLYLQGGQNVKKKTTRLERSER